MSLLTGIPFKRAPTGLYNFKFFFLIAIRAKRYLKIAFAGDNVAEREAKIIFLNLTMHLYLIIYCISNAIGEVVQILKEN